MNSEKLKIIRELTYKSNITQRFVSQACSMSLGKTNKLFNSLISDEYVKVEDNSYILTEKSQDLIKNYKVDNAIIMAEGFGSHFVPLSNEIPKGLMEIYGERIIERQIKQLIEMSITDITIVVGYLKEKFDYLIDKYGVKLFYNPDYTTRNSLSTLYHLRHLLKNTYILSSDNYMRDNIFNTYEFESWCSAVMTEGDTAEWCLDIDKKDRIKGIEVGGYDKWQMYGPAYFSKEFSEKIRPLIEYTYNQPGSSNFYWEEVLKHHIGELEMYVNKKTTDAVYEFATVEEIRKFDPTYKEKSNSEIRSLVASIFKVKEDKVKNIRPLKLGMTNKSFGFEINEKKYICRIPGKGTETLINRYEEYSSYQAVIPLGITDNIAYVDPKTGIKISEFESNSRVVDAKNPDELKTCMRILKKLHSSGVSVPHGFSIEKSIELYEDLCRGFNAILYEDYPLVRAKISELLSILKKMELPSALSHIDPNCHNFLVLANGDIKLIDWEYAGMCDPVIDISMFAIYSSFDEKQLEELMGFYFEDGPSYEERLRVYIYVSLGGFLWSIWAEYKQALGVCFGDYTLKMYRYAKDYYKKCMELIKECNENVI